MHAYTLVNLSTLRTKLYLISIFSEKLSRRAADDVEVVRCRFRCARCVTRASLCREKHDLLAPCNFICE